MIKNTKGIEGWVNPPKADPTRPLNRIEKAFGFFCVTVVGFVGIFILINILPLALSWLIVLAPLVVTIVFGIVVFGALASTDSFVEALLILLLLK